MPWESGAIAHCSGNLEPVIREGHKVVVPMGGTAIRRMLGITRGANFSVEDFHGTVSWSEEFQVWVVPSFHPSHLQRGAMNLFGTVLWDIRRALDLASGKWQLGVMPNLVVDPDPQWFEEWGDAYCEAAEVDPLGIWLSTDCETADKASKHDEGMLGAKDQSWQITHMNFSCHPDEGVTVPAIEPYLKTIRRIHASPGVKCVWNGPYDVPRAKYNGFPMRGPIYDFMDGWHMLQSDCPRGLGYTNPYYSDYPVPWKHLGTGDGIYRAFDGVNTQRCAYGIARDLQTRGLWERFLEDMVDWSAHTTGPCAEVGILLDEKETAAFGERLRVAASGFWDDLQALVPEELKNLHGPSKDGWKKFPGESKPVEVFAKKKVERPVIEVRKKSLVKVCLSCGAEEIAKTHRCKEKELTPQVTSEEREVARWFVREDFNPGSSPQKLRLMAHYKDKPGKNKQTGRPSADKVTLEQLSKHSKSEKAKETYRKILEYQSVHKVKTTYVDSSLRRLEADEKVGILDGRLHPTFTNKPSTMRPSCTAPNLYNVRADKDGKKSLAAGFKKCIVAADEAEVTRMLAARGEWPTERIRAEASGGCVLVELDWVGQEAVFTGWYAGAPRFIRLSRLGIHDFFNSHVRGVPADELWPDDKLREYLKEIKEKYEDTRDPCKRTVHGVDYGLTPYGMHERFPHIFKTLKMAKEYAAKFAMLFPEIHQWQEKMIDLAVKQHYLGGAGQHPFGYMHWFWDVQNFRKINAAVYHKRGLQGMRRSVLNGVYYAVEPGADANRVKAFFPQSTNAAILRKTARVLFHPESPQFIGDAFFGRSPLRAPIYDSFLLEIPVPQVDRVVEIVAQEMLRPIREMPLPPEWGMGEFLQVGVDAKIGKNWGEMEKLSLKGIAVPDAGDLETLVDEEWDEEDEAEEAYDWYGVGAQGRREESAAYASDDDVPF